MRGMWLCFRGDCWTRHSGLPVHLTFRHLQQAKRWKSWLLHFAWVKATSRWPVWNFSMLLR